MNQIKRRALLKKSLPVLLVVIFVFGLLCLLHPFRRDVRVVAQTAVAHLYAPPSEPFPGIRDTAQLTATQRRIVALARQQYAQKPVTYDATVLQYTQGVKEPWCADFVSWIYMRAERPFTNPNSGSWRIPGVYTLQAYFQAGHTYVPAGTYVPKTGDVAIYHTGEGHTNIVLSVQKGRMTTIGGNETGHLRIETQTYTKGTDGLDGFGVL